jgi:hypothetical protein
MHPQKEDTEIGIGPRAGFQSLPGLCSRVVFAPSEMLSLHKSDPLRQPSALRVQGL